MILDFKIKEGFYFKIKKGLIDKEIPSFEYRCALYLWSSFLGTPPADS